MDTLSGRERYRTNRQSLGWTEEQEDQNVGDTERVLSGLVGSGLLVSGFLRRSWVGAVLAAVGAVLLQRGVSGHCLAYQALRTTTDTLGRRKVRTGRAVKIQKTIRVGCPAKELYRFWRQVENLPKVMSHLESVQAINERLSHWVVRAIPMGGPTIEWDAEIINEIEHELIGWRSLQGADVDHAGSVRFRPTPDGRATEITVTLQYAPPAGQLGVAVANMFGEDPERQIEDDLRRFKETMEAQTYSVP